MDFVESIVLFKEAVLLDFNKLCRHFGDRRVPAATHKSQVLGEVLVVALTTFHPVAEHGGLPTRGPPKTFAVVRCLLDLSFLSWPECCERAVQNSTTPLRGKKRRARHPRRRDWAMHQSSASLAAMPAAPSPQKAHVKKGMDHDELRRKREATTIQLRKEKKVESIQKRRRDVGGDQESSASLSARRSSDQVGALPDPALKVKLDSMPEDIALLNSDDPAEQLEATTRFRKLLSIERNPPIAEVIAAGAVPRLVQFCQCCACRRIHFFAP